MASMSPISAVNPWGKQYSPPPPGIRYQNGQWTDYRGGTPQPDRAMQARAPGGPYDPGGLTGNTRPWWWHAEMLPQATSAFQNLFGSATQAPTGYRNPGEMWMGQQPGAMLGAWGRSDASMGPDQLKAVEAQRQGLIQNMINFSKGGNVTMPGQGQRATTPLAGVSQTAPIRNTAQSAQQTQTTPQRATQRFAPNPAQQQQQYGMMNVLRALLGQQGGYPTSGYQTQNQGIPAALTALRALFGIR